MPANQNLVPPHGGDLINRVVTPTAAKSLTAEAQNWPSITLSPRERFDLEMIAIGAFSPLKGFQGQADVERVSRELRLADGTVWPIPVTLAPPADIDDRIEVGQTVALRGDQRRLLATLRVREKFRRDKRLEIKNVYGTEDEKHPGVAAIQKQGDVLLAGDVDVIDPHPEPEFAEYRLPPKMTRELFAARGWKTVAAFQTRNPIHRAHEYLTKVALEVTDGLLVHPLVGETKSDDIPAAVRMDCYKVLIDRYYNPQRVLLAVMPLAMRYAGPREAILHALVRKNYGATHFIVGRDHAGVGNYYGTYDAQRIFDRFDVPREIGITPLNFEHAFYCKRAKSMATSKTTNSGPDEQVALSGTKVRELLRGGQRPPEEFSRPEVADVLIRWAQAQG
jgi:sulfate adenylyltransferase